MAANRKKLFSEPWPILISVLMLLSTMTGPIMNRGSQYSQNRLPAAPLFLMLLMAFVDGSVGKVAKARSNPVDSPSSGLKDRKRRPIRGRRGPAWRVKLGTPGKDVISSDAAPCRMVRQRGQSHTCYCEVGNGFSAALTRRETPDGLIQESGGSEGPAPKEVPPRWGDRTMGCDGRLETGRRQDPNLGRDRGPSGKEIGKCLII